MASRTEVKSYLAHWFQLGKQVVSDDGYTTYQPTKVIQGDHFSPEFEDCWAHILETEGRAYYLKGTDQTIAQLLSPAWDIVNCARCEMPIPLTQKELELHNCPCHDLPNWPNEDIPRPRLPINNHRHLSEMNERLKASATKN
ncbi:MAG: hypothetical protein AAGC93_24205 [Cyanobacteria bacterium P01_F01_bin.53]